MKIESYQTLAPPSHGRLPGKFAPPATISAPWLVPAKGVAKPSRSGRGGSCCQWRVVMGGVGAQPTIINTTRSSAVLPNFLLVPSPPYSGETARVRGGSGGWRDCDECMRSVKGEVRKTDQFSICNFNAFLNLMLHW